jgi:hypothetical protein
MILRMNSSKSGTVNAVSPWFGLQIMPLAIRWLRVGPKEVTFRSKMSGFLNQLAQGRLLDFYPLVVDGLGDG